MHVIQLIGRYAGETVDLPYEIAKARVEAGTARLPDGVIVPGIVPPVSETVAKIVADPVPRPRGRPRVSHRSTESLF